MIVNPFTPAEMATQPDTFIGRSVELELFSRALRQGSVAIQGSVGIGKSSLLSRSLLNMEGFNSAENSHSIMAVGHRDVTSIDEAARLVLEKMAHINDSVGKFTVGIPNIVQYESAEAYDYFKAGRHLPALVTILKQDALVKAIDKTGLLIIAVDEADKCPQAIARLVRAVCNEIQLAGITNVRFVLAGVSPFVEEMVKEDEGVMRFVYKTINLEPFVEEDARLLVESKFEEVANSVDSSELVIDAEIIERILQVSGGHPHILQLLGSHVIEREVQDPDGAIDSKDLVGAFRAICYESRSTVYENLLHDIQLQGAWDAFLELIRLARGGFPGAVSRSAAEKSIDRDQLQWLMRRNVISVRSDTEYGFVDEFLRIRLLMDNEDRPADLDDQLAESGAVHFDNDDD